MLFRSALCNRLLDRKNPASGAQAQELVNKSFPGRIKVKSAAGEDSAESAESTDGAAAAPAAAASDQAGGISVAALAPGGIAALVREWFAAQDDENKRQGIQAVGAVLRQFAQEGAAVGKKAAGGVGAVAPAALAASPSA